MRGLARLCVLVGCFLSIANQTQAQDCQGWLGYVYGNSAFEGLSSLYFCHAEINFDWGINAPAAAIEPDNFSIRWTSTQYFASGTYQFSITATDGIRFYIDDNLLISDMEDVTDPRLLTATYTIEAFEVPHFLILEYANFTGDANVQLTWTLSNPDEPVTIVNPSDQHWLVTYYTSFDGNPLYYESYPPDGISRDYRVNLPPPLINLPEWSARWQRDIYFEAGLYTFTARVNNALRILIDGQEIFNVPEFREGESYHAEAEIAAGHHQVTVEHLNAGVEADLFVTWTPPIGTQLLENGCNSATAGINGSEPPCLTQPSQNQASLFDGTVARGPLHLRATPSQAAESLQYISRDEAYPVLGRSSDSLWVQLDVNGTVGWSMAEFMDFEQALATLPITDDQQGIVLLQVSNLPNSFAGVQAITLTETNLQAITLPDANPTASLPEGTVVNVVGRSLDGLWLQIAANGIQGWSPRQWYQILLGDVESLPITD